MSTRPKYSFKLKLKEYQKELFEQSKKYTFATESQLEKIIYTQGESNLYAKEKVQINQFAEEKKTDDNLIDVVYKKYTMDDVINGKKLHKYLHCSSKQSHDCYLQDFIAQQDKDSKIYPKIGNFKYVVEPGYIISTAKCDVLVLPKDMQYLKCCWRGQTLSKKDILHMAYKIKISTQIYKTENKEDGFWKASDLISILPKVMVKYDKNKFERVLQVSLQFYIGYTIVCYTECISNLL